MPYHGSKRQWGIYPCKLMKVTHRSLQKWLPIGFCKLKWLQKLKQLLRLSVGHSEACRGWKEWVYKGGNERLRGALQRLLASNSASRMEIYIWKTFSSNFEWKGPTQNMDSKPTSELWLVVSKYLGGYIKLVLCKMKVCPICGIQGTRQPSLPHPAILKKFWLSETDVKEKNRYK